MMLIRAQYDDVCLECCKKVTVGDLVYWAHKITYHRDCYTRKETANGKANAVHTWLLRNGVDRKPQGRV